MITTIYGCRSLRNGRSGGNFATPEPVRRSETITAEPKVRTDLQSVAILLLIGC
jgi:hypothetical protein